MCTCAVLSGGWNPGCAVASEVKAGVNVFRSRLNREMNLRCSSIASFLGTFHSLAEWTSNDEARSQITHRTPFKDPHLTVLVSVSWVLRNSRNPLETFGPSRFCDISPGSARMWDELKVQFSGQLPTSILLGILLKHSPTFSFVIEMVKCVCGDPSHTNYWKSLELNLTKTIFTSILSVYKVEFRDFCDH